MTNPTPVATLAGGRFEVQGRRRHNWAILARRGTRERAEEVFAVWAEAVRTGAAPFYADMRLVEVLAEARPAHGAHAPREEETR